LGNSIIFCGGISGEMKVWGKCTSKKNFKKQKITNDGESFDKNLVSVYIEEIFCFE